MNNLDRQSVIQVISEIWVELLAVENVGSNDNFFELGGDSVLLIMVAMQVEEKLGVMVEAEMIYEAPTPGELADAIISQA